MEGYASFREASLRFFCTFLNEGYTSIRGLVCDILHQLLEVGGQTVPGIFIDP